MGPFLVPGLTSPWGQRVWLIGWRKVLLVVCSMGLEYLASIWLQIYGKSIGKYCMHRAFLALEEFLPKSWKNVQDVGGLRVDTWDFVFCGPWLSEKSGGVDFVSGRGLLCVGPYSQGRHSFIFRGHIIHCDLCPVLRHGKCPSNASWLMRNRWGPFFRVHRTFFFPFAIAVYFYILGGGCFQICFVVNPYVLWFDGHMVPTRWWLKRGEFSNPGELLTLAAVEVANHQKYPTVGLQVTWRLRCAVLACWQNLANQLVNIQSIPNCRCLLNFPHPTSNPRRRTWLDMIAKGKCNDWVPVTENMGSIGGSSFLTQVKVEYIMIWYDMIWYDMIWYDMIWYVTHE